MNFVGLNEHKRIVRVDSGSMSIFTLTMFSLHIDEHTHIRTYVRTFHIHMPERVYVNAHIHSYMAFVTDRQKKRQEVKNFKYIIHLL